jgi:hypothetical protein
MKANSFRRNLIRAVLILAILIIVVGGASAIFLWINLPHDDYRANITKVEAQSLVSFPICVPTYVPPETDPSPQFIYESDAANVPEETYILMRYRRMGGQEEVFEVYQKYTRDEGMKTEYSQSAHEGAKVSLLYWMFPYPEFLSESVGLIVEEMHLEASVFQTDQTIWWLYEIVDPIEYRSTMTKWITNHVEYRILSYLPAEEIKRVTLSMFECSSR